MISMGRVSTSSVMRRWMPAASSRPPERLPNKMSGEAPWEVHLSFQSCITAKTRPSGSFPSISSTAAAVELIEGKEPEGLVFAVIQLWNDKWTSHGASPLILFGRRSGGREEAAGIQRLITDEVETRPMEIIGTALHRE